MRYLFSLFLLFSVHIVSAQQDSTATNIDTSLRNILVSVMVTSYGMERKIQETPAAINYISPQQLDKYSNTSVLQAINATPGIRMEERSPGSYRLNIRGSSLRSPFGVRNVKIYYNDIPLTDPSGFSYFNQLGFFNIASLQLIKGPGSSLYGAGTGGVMLINSINKDTGDGVTLMYEAGSYGMQNIAAEVLLGNKESRSIIRYQHQSIDGYRVQSAAERNVISWDGSIKSAGKATIETHFLYNNLNYQTPGALTETEYNADPTAARPHTAAAMGAIESHAQIFQQNVLAGFSASYQFNSVLRNTTTLYGSYTQLTNPTIRNYTRSNEPHFGGRTTFRYERPIGKKRLTLLAGAEGQQGYVLARTYTNSNGQPGILQSDDETKSTQASGFGQATLQTGKWIIEAGTSVNASSVNIKRLTTPTIQQTRDYPIQVSPRLAASYHVQKDMYLYANIAKGFSPAASTELLPTGGTLNSNLSPETGTNYEAGMKATFLNSHLQYDGSIFCYTLQNAIVLRKDAAGGDEYINAGSTRQYGFEQIATYHFFYKNNVFSIADVYLSTTVYDFRYHDFIQGTNDISDKYLPGTAPNTVTAGADFKVFNAIIINTTYFFSDEIALNDLNTVYSKAYHLLDIKGSYTIGRKKASAKLFAGVNNMLSQKYSLGNDINAAGGRYYNAAAGINYYGGLILSYK